MIASATEIVDALGHARSLVARSHECDYPESMRSLPVCTRPRIDIHADSREIDRAVKESAENLRIDLRRAGRCFRAGRAHAHPDADSVRGLRREPPRRRAGACARLAEPSQNRLPAARFARSDLGGYPPRRERIGYRGSWRGVIAQKQGEMHVACPSCDRHERRAPGSVHRMDRAPDGSRQLDSGTDPTWRAR